MANFVNAPKNTLINLDLVQQIKFDAENFIITYMIADRQEREEYVTQEFYNAAVAQIDTLIIS
jgi:hypothetical protein